MIGLLWLLCLPIPDVGETQPSPPPSRTETTSSPVWLQALIEAEAARSTGRYAAAADGYARALTEAEKLDPQGLPTASVLNNSGYYFQQLGEFREAIRRYSRALEIFDRKADPSGHHVIEVALNLSGAYLETGQISRAESLLRRFLAREAALSPIDRAALLGDLGSVVVEQGNLAEGERLFQEALRILEKENKADLKQRIVVALSNLSSIHAQTGRLPDAAHYAERARMVLATFQDPAPVLLIKTLANSAVISAIARRPEDAERYYREAITLCEDTFGQDHYLLGHVLSTYSQFLQLTKRKSEAKKVQTRAQRILDRFARENVLGFTVDAKALINSPVRPSNEMPPRGALP